LINRKLIRSFEPEQRISHQVGVALKKAAKVRVVFSYYQDLWGCSYHFIIQVFPNDL